MKAPIRMLTPSAAMVSRIRRRLELQALELGVVLGGDDDAQAGEERDDVDREGDEERIAPAPLDEVGVGERADQVDEEGAGDEEADRRAELGDHRVPAALALGGVHREERGEAVPGAAEGDALGDAHDRQDQDRVDAGERVVRGEGDAGGGAAEQEERQRQFDAPAPAPVDGAEDEGAEGPRDEAEREDREGPQHRLDRRQEGKERAREDEDRGDRVDEEVEELGAAADDDADGDVPGARGMPVRLRHGPGRVAHQGPPLAIRS